LNLTLALARAGVLERHGVKVIGASIEAIRVAEEREAFKRAMVEIGLDVPVSIIASSVEQALAFGEKNSYPVVIRPSFTLGGSGGGIAYNAEECETIGRRGLD